MIGGVEFVDEVREGVVELDDIAGVSLLYD